MHLKGRVRNTPFLYFADLSHLRTFFLDIAGYIMFQNFDCQSVCNKRSYKPLLVSKYDQTKVLRTHYKNLTNI